jgi:predicted RNase H-like HicB family nuclease
MSISDGPTKQVVFTLDVFVEPDDDGFYAYCPALEGLHVGGDTLDEAVKNAVDAATAYIRSLIKHGDPIPLRIIRTETAQRVPLEDTPHPIRRTEQVAVALP